jgi:hypothetical protein
MYFTGDNLRPLFLKCRTLVAEGSCLPTAPAPIGATGHREPLTENAPGHVQNNYVRPEGQNVGNVRILPP